MELMNHNISAFMHQIYSQTQQVSIPCPRPRSWQIREASTTVSPTLSSLLVKRLRGTYCPLEQSLTEPSTQP